MRAKCFEMRDRGGVEAGGYLANTDILLVHVDGEVADDPEVACAKPCPPPSDTADALRQTVLSWMGGDTGDPRVVVAIPMKETEAWVVAALRPGEKLLQGTGEACFECRDKPSALLAGGAPRLLRSGKKHKSDYQEVERELVEGFEHAQKLSQVTSFELYLRAAHAAFLLSDVMET